MVHHNLHIQLHVYMTSYPMGYYTVVTAVINYNTQYNLLQRF